LMPMLFTVCWYFTRLDLEQRDIKANLLERGVLILMVVFSIGPFIFPFIRDIHYIGHYYFKASFLFGVTLVLLYLFIKCRNQRIILTMAFLLLIRIAFDWFIWPIRYDKYINLKEETIKVAKITKDKDLYIYNGTKVDRSTSFYLTREKGQIIHFKGNHFTSDDFCIVDKESMQELKKSHVKFKKLFDFETLPEGYSLHLIGFAP